MTATPYGKDVPFIDNEVYKRFAADIPEIMKSKHLSWEAPAPSWWCPNGYAVVIMDHRGSGASSGASRPFSTQDWDDYAKAIEWAADQPWSTGKIGLTGISYLGLNRVVANGSAPAPYLTADMMLSKGKPSVEATFSSQAPTGECVQFITPVAEEEYEVTGHGHVRLAVSLTDHKGEAEPDLDVYVALRKINAQGLLCF
ncbi:hypothetical protein ACHAPV_009257 [Trichoderma viride]